MQAECPVTRARAGLLHTPHGIIETPVFMPVGTQATVKGLAPRELAERPGRPHPAGQYLSSLPAARATSLIRALGGLHRFMSWPRAILTDSGGFQVFSLSGLRKITDEGVVFQSHLNGDTHTFTPESTVETQLAFGSDIMMVLDECPEYPVSHEYARDIHAPHCQLGAQAAYALFLQSAAPNCPPRHALFPIVQGSMFAGSAARMRQPRWWIWTRTATPSADFRWANRGP